MRVRLVLIPVLLLGVSVAKADTIENLVFTGTATCEAGFAFQECSSGSGGSVTGSYNLDVDTQAILGAWSFATPYGVISSSMSGSAPGVYTQRLANGLDNEAGFLVYTTTPSNFDEELALYFAAPNVDQLGAVYSPGYPFTGSSICQNVPGLPNPGCEPDVNLAGTTALAGISGAGTEVYYAFTWGEGGGIRS